MTTAVRVVALVEWTDASSQQGELEPHELRPLVRLRTVGWLVREDKASVSLAVEVCETDGRYRDVVHIPRVCISRMRKWKP